MALYQRILLATDFSPHSRRAMALARTLARASGAELHVLYVNVLSSLHTEYRGLAATDEYTRTLIAAAEETLHGIPDARRLVTRRVVRTDESPARAILEYAGEQGADLIVVGSRGLAGIKRVLLGSVAAKVVHAATVPVLVAGQGADAADDTEEAPLRHVVAATDLSDASRPGVLHAADIAVQHGARLTVVHVLVPATVDPYDPGAPVPRTEPDRARASLAQFIAELELPVDAEQDVAIGPADAEIAAAAVRHEADLLVVGSHGRSAVQRVLLGSVADKVVRVSACPVLVHRPRPV